MTEKYLLIGEAASLLDVTPKTLRHYEELGLLAPHRSESDYRLYGIDQLLRVQRIRRLQELGLSLSQIKRLLDDDGDPLDWHDLLLTLRDEIDEQIDLLEDRREQIERLLEQGVPDALALEVDLPHEVMEIEASLGGLSSAQHEGERQFYGLLDALDGRWMISLEREYFYGNVILSE